MHLSEVYSLILKDSIHKYKYRNSKVVPLDYKPSDGKKGAIFAYRSKEHMMQQIGLVLQSEEALWENEGAFTHWTPNTYSWGGYSKKEGNLRVVEGHSEHNLQQINTLFIDFDDPKQKCGASFDEKDILFAATDLGLLPTAILRTDKGYQAFFVLKNAWFISSKKNYQSLALMKVVSENIRIAFNNHSCVRNYVDIGCNHFGISRIPTSENLVYFERELLYDPQILIDFSLKTGIVRTKPTLNLVSQQQKRNQTTEKWFELLLHNPKIVGKKGQIGRNNTIFTLALAMYSSKKSYKDCYDTLDQFNSKLDKPVSKKEFDKVVDNAYSGKYYQAKKEKIITLMELYFPTISEKEYFSNYATDKDYRGWYKFKKAREYRKYSHKHEWKADIVAYLNKKSTADSPKYITTKKEIEEEINIPRRSLDKVLKELAKSGAIYYQVKAGRAGGIKIATKAALVVNLITLKRTEREAFIENISAFLPGELLQEIKLGAFKAQRQQSLWANSS